MLVHAAMLAADPGSHYVRSENALNLALLGAAWVIADALRPRARRDLEDMGLAG